MEVLHAKPGAKRKAPALRSAKDVKKPCEMSRLTPLPGKGNVVRDFRR